MRGRGHAALAVRSPSALLLMGLGRGGGIVAAARISSRPSSCIIGDTIEERHTVG